jgi:hypothetical protein
MLGLTHVWIRRNGGLIEGYEMCRIEGWKGLRGRGRRLFGEYRIDLEGGRGEGRMEVGEMGE